MPKHITVEYDGRVFSNFREAYKEACRADVPEITARKRVFTYGWSVDDAFTTAPVAAPDRRGYKVIRGEE